MEWPGESVGIVQRGSFCDLGRVVLPKELRDMLDIQSSEQLGFFVDESQMMMRKYVSSSALG
ncbi:AbrB/MazE/SpoVT family DNA-binding domain-containing protein [Paenibacillus sp. LHD-38]|uniref:AbrB/MazE/SpoVT family DNA-binding domain-containing protein n=1 Tax=Paenibacillus sp. LHD-38 TaxID=3072143 RepID=UPI00280D9E2B|nr:AbrB/MazE/SpoVT family DNA-binding domain-containing protein [Paenibacillus sp. LHD-38]MDQ8733262.1 AbrB/MazE/SpoVT family DNA-binding domain-containing protein [Paenibacillus sp. LHD-38]